MMNFDEHRFLRIQSAAAALAEPIDATMSGLLAGGMENVFFLGTGGAAILMQPAALLLQRGSTFPVHCDLSAELVLGGSRHLGPKSIAIIPSLSGTTRESLEMLAYCKSRGAAVIGLTAHKSSPLAEGADRVFVNFAEDDTSSESFYLQSLLIVLSIMKHRGEFDGYDAAVGELCRLPRLLIGVKENFEARAGRLAETLKEFPYHIISGAGSTWPQAFYYGMCILEEMQWIRTRPVHASDFFHGTLELVEKGVSVLLLKGEDPYRSLVDRVEAFAERYTDRLSILDTRDMELPGISERVRGLISPILLATVLERASAQLEILRNHPLTTRRYYKKVAY
jgi:fructoselysine-6-phosphate deglycase